MLLNGHKLNAIVASVFDSWNNPVSKLSIGVYSALYIALSPINLINLPFQREPHIFSMILVLQFSCFSIDMVQEGSSIPPHIEGFASSRLST